MIHQTSSKEEAVFILKGLLAVRRQEPNDLIYRVRFVP
jgi:hypothetical protein